MSGDSHILIGACLGASVNPRHPEPDPVDGARLPQPRSACEPPCRASSRRHPHYRIPPRDGAFGCALVHSGLKASASSAPQAPAPCVSGSSRNLRSFESAPTWTTLSCMDQNLYRRLMPRPKVGRSRPTTAAAAPAAFHPVHLQVLGREQMAIAADVGYSHGFEDTF
jgi:hypothetical protein